MNLPRFVIDLLERAATTYLEALIGFLLLASTLDVSALGAAALAALPALFSVLKAGIYEFLRVRPRRSFLAGLVERTIATYLVTFLGLVAVNPGDVATYRLAVVAALPAALAVLKGALGSRLGNPSDASVVALPPAA